MRIECPGCKAAYDVPESRLRPGLALRCHRCGLEFPAVPPAPEDEPLPPLPPSSLVPPEAAAPPGLTALRHPEAAGTQPARKPGRALAAAWAGSLGVLAVAVVAAVLWRAPITAAWPPAARAYAVLGLRVPAPARGPLAEAPTAEAAPAAPAAPAATD